MPEAARRAAFHESLVERAWQLPDGISELDGRFRVQKDRKMVVLSPLDLPIGEVGHVLVYPKPSDRQAFINAAKGLRGGGGPSEKFPGVVGVFRLFHGRDGIVVQYKQACFKTGAGSPPLTKSREDYYLSWRKRALREAILLSQRHQKPLFFPWLEPRIGVQHFIGYRNPRVGDGLTAFERELSEVAQRLGVPVDYSRALEDYVVVPNPPVASPHKRVAVPTSPVAVSPRGAVGRIWARIRSKLPVGRRPGGSK